MSSFVCPQIKPHGNTQTWVVEAALDKHSCSALIDFNVPNKPSPPPVNLTATQWVMSADSGGKKLGMAFTDPTGTLNKDPTFPLNWWVEI